MSNNRRSKKQKSETPPQLTPEEQAERNRRFMWEPGDVTRHSADEPTEQIPPAERK